jgi:para-nitrobenzyl esterase
MIVGWTRRETSFFFCADPAVAATTRDRVVELMTATFGDGAAEAYDGYLALDPALTPAEVLVQFTTDRDFRQPALALADRQAAAGRRVWSYEVEVGLPAADGRLESCHCCELPFVFDTAPAWRRASSPLFGGYDFEAATGLGAAMSGAWCGFARTGAPPLAGAEWPAHAPGAVMALSDRRDPHPGADSFGEVWRLQGPPGRP